MSALEFARDGAERHHGLASEALPLFLPFFAATATAPGTRLGSLGPAAGQLGPDSRIGAVVSKALGAVARPVRALAFDKSNAANWALGWHQDRVICVRDRVDVAGYGPWTVKDGLHHVVPPANLLERMATVRIHLDPVNDANAPLKIAPGSHRCGRIEERDIAARVRQCGQAACLADAGDVWIYATLVLHASDRAAPGRRRRVLQIDYSADSLPGGLQWQLP